MNIQVKKQHFKVILTLIALLLTLNIQTQAQSCPDWQWAVKAGSAGTHVMSSANGVATDAAGNSYITGHFSGTVRFGDNVVSSKDTANINTYSFYVAKFNSSGKPEWITTGDGLAIPNDIAIDENGNSYITGQYGQALKLNSNISLSIPTSNDIFVAKIDSTGKWAWATSANGNSIDRAFGIAVDKKGIYVTGSTGSSSSSFGNLTLNTPGVFYAKIDFKGQWQTAKIIHPNTYTVNSIANDGNGNTYIGGYYKLSTYLAGYLTKISETGSTTWSQSYYNNSGNTFINDITYAGSVNGGIYITGYFTGSFLNSSQYASKGGKDVFFAYITDYGSTSQVFTAGGTGDDEAMAITSDQSGILIAGKYANSITFGSTTLTSSYNGFVAKYSGGWKWASGVFNANFKEISADGKGNFVTVGDFSNSVRFSNLFNFSNNNTTSNFIASGNSNGIWQWVNIASEGLQQHSYYYTKTATDKSGNTYVTGLITGITKLGNIILFPKKEYDFFVAKMDNTGKWLWAVRSGSANSELSEITYDDIGNIYITGTFTGKDTIGGNPVSVTAYTEKGFYISKLNSKGEWQWVTYGKATESQNYYNNITDITADASGNSYICGIFGTNATFGNDVLTGSSDIFIAKINTAGQWQWARTAEGASYCQATAITTDNAGSAVITGRFNNGISFGNFPLSSNNSSAYIANISSGGTWQWAENITTNTNSSTDPMDISINTVGNIYISGQFSGSAKFGTIELSPYGNGDIFVAQFDNKGKIKWAAKAGSASTGGQDVAYNIIADANGNAYVSGRTFANAIFGSKNVITQQLYISEPFVAKINNSGQWQWVVSAGSSTGNGYHKGLGLSSSGDIFLRGDFAKEINFGSIQLSSASGDLFIAKMKETLLKVNAGQNQTIQCGNSIKLGSSAEGYTSVSWSPASGLDNSNILTPLASPRATTTYTLQATNACGDKLTSQVTVTVTPVPLTATAAKSTINCGETTQLDISTDLQGQLSYSWTPVAGLNDPKIANPVAKPAYTTTYNVTVTSADLCVSKGTVTITVNNPNPPAVGLSTSTGERFFCNNGLTLSAAPGFASYRWNTGATTPSIIPLTPGTYSVEIIDNNGCGNRDSITLTPLTKITAPDGPYLCPGQPNASVRLDAGAGFDSYQWSNGQQTQTLTVTSPGTYSVKVTKGNCEYTSQIQVLNHPGTTNAEFTHQSNGLQTQFTALTQGIRFVDWTFGDGNNSSEINPKHNYSQPGTYTVCLELTDFCGATDKKCRTISVNNSVGVEEEKANKDIIKIYPNPTTNMLTIETSKAVVSPIIISDLTGRQILYIVNDKATQFKVDLSSLSNGLYFINLNQENYKFIKQ